MRRLVVLAAMLAVAGCTAQQGGGAAPTAAPSEPSAIWARFVSCARAHGEAAMPDPVVDDTGRATFPEAPGFSAKQALGAVRGACGGLLDRLPPRANPFARQQVTAQDLEIRRQYARCLREHGLPDFPDPDAEGNLHIPESFWTPERREQDNLARPFCEPLRDQVKG
jgi:hypothetical protein